MPREIRRLIQQQPKIFGKSGTLAGHALHETDSITLTMRKAKTILDSEEQLMHARTQMVAMPKAELHAHFNGCVPAEVFHCLILQHEIVLPHGFALPKDLIVQQPVPTLMQYFRPWQAFKLLPVGQECLNEMVSAAIRQLAKDGVRYAELRNSPFNIAQINSISLERTLEWLVEAFQRFGKASDVDVRLIVSFTRHDFEIDSADRLIRAVSNVKHNGQIVGVDLSGDEEIAAHPELARLICSAKHDQGLGVCIHAGETGNADNVRWAITDCDADRIGHCLAASKSPYLMEMLAANDVCVETCLTSNLLTSSCINLDSHPIHAFIEHEVPFVLCADNPEVHGKTLSDEYSLFIAATGRFDIIARMYESQKHYSFS